MTRPPPRSTLFPYTPLFRSLLSVRLLLARPPRQPRLLRPQATRGETPPPSRPRPRPPAHQRPPGHAQQPTSLPAKLQTRRLTRALGCPSPRLLDDVAAQDVLAERDGADEAHHAN